MAIIIRPMTREDIPFIVAIIADHDGFDGPRSQKYYDAYFSNPERLQNEREQNFVATDDENGQAVGVCGFGPDKYDTPKVLWLNWLYVRKDYRGRRIGFMLLKHSLDILSKMSISKAYLDTCNYHTYQKAIDLYIRVGFKTEGNLVDYYGDNDNMVIMGLEMSKLKQM